MRIPSGFGRLAIVLATTLTLALPAAATPIPVLKWMQMIRAGFGNVVEVKAEFEYAEGEDEQTIINVNSVRLQANSKEILNLKITNNEVTQTQVNETVEAIIDAPISIDEAQASLMNLWYYGRETDPLIGNPLLEQFDFQIVQLDKDTSGIFSDAGKELSKIEGETSPSTGQTLDTIISAVLSEASNQPAQTLQEFVDLSTGDINDLATKLELLIKPFIAENSKELSSKGITNNAENIAAFTDQTKNALYLDLLNKIEVRGQFIKRSVLKTTELKKAFSDNGMAVELFLKK